MSDMICPICGKDLVEIELGECWFLVCCNSKCRCKGVASDTVWKFLTVAIKNRKALSQELIRTGKALDYAINVIQTVAKMSDKLSREYGETLVEQLDNIQAYCWQEGYVLTHEEDLESKLKRTKS